MKQSNEFRALRNAFQSAVRSAEAGRVDVVSLTRKCDSLESETPALKAAIEQAEKAKRKALDDHVKGGATQEELTTARETYDSAIKANEHATELVEATQRARKRAEQSLPQLDQAVLQARRAFYRHVLEDIKTDLQEAVGGKISQAWVAGIETGGEDFFYMVGAIFGPIPTTEQVKQARRELAEEYELTL